MKATHLIIALICLLLLFSCKKDDDNNTNNPDNPTIPFQNEAQYWEYVSNRDWVVFAHVYKVPETKGMMQVNVWCEKFPENLTNLNDVSLTINGENINLMLDDGQLYSYPTILMVETAGLDVVLQYNDTAVISKTLAIPATPQFTDWEVSAPTEPATFSWTLASNASFQVIDFYGGDQYWENEDNVAYFLPATSRSITIPANTLECPSFYVWDTSIMEVNLVEQQNNTLFTTDSDFIDSDSTPPTFAKIRERHLAFHKRAR